MAGFGDILSRAQALITEQIAVGFPYSSDKSHPCVPFPQSEYVSTELSATVSVNTTAIADTSTHVSSFINGICQLSQKFFCFYRAPSSATRNTRSAGAFEEPNYVFVLPLCAIRRVERLHGQNHIFSLSITTWTGNTSSDNKSSSIDVNSASTTTKTPKIILRLDGNRQQCEKFCDVLKKGLRDGMKNINNMRAIVDTCYSEWLLATVNIDQKKDTSPVASSDLSTGKEQAKLMAPDTGLGMMFKYPGDARKLRDKGKIRLWMEYFKNNGRNMTLVRQADLPRLVRIGLPNRLRGEMWDILSGAFYMRLGEPKLYEETLEKYRGRTSVAIDEIEKDLNRSLPEYPAFQIEEGIGRLRRVLTAYSWTNSDVGYCQAMNIVVAAMLMYKLLYRSVVPLLIHDRYLSETQAFYVLSVLCDRLLPGYYSMTMYGTLLDQRVFESLVDRTLPILSEHLSKTDVQLSVVSLPWFLSLYINSMPLIFAFRVLDVFFLEGPRVLFQVGLAILRVNGAELLDAADDGAFISVLKAYFSRLAESAHPKSENPKLRAVTNFQALMVVAFREFSGITMQVISDLRAKHKNAVLDNIESFAKRTSIRNLGPESRRISNADLNFIYDRFYGVLYERQARMKMIFEADERQRQSILSKTGSLFGGGNDRRLEVGRVGYGPSPTEMDYDSFREFMTGISRWSVTDIPMSPLKEQERGNVNNLFSPTGNTRSTNLSPWGDGPEPANHDFLRRLYKSWKRDDAHALNLQDVVTGLAKIKATRDILTNIAFFFSLYDEDADEKIDREAVLHISEDLLFLSRCGLDSEGDSIPQTPALNDDGTSRRQQNKDEQFLGAISAFTRRCFEYAEPENVNLISPVENSPITSTSNTSLEFDQTKSKIHANAALNPDTPLYLSLPTFRMLVLADEALESFFDSGFPNSFHLADGPLSSSLSNSSHLTTFTSTGVRVGIPSRSFPLSPGGSLRVGSIPTAGKGIRGMLDSIVADGMKVAAEVKRRMDEAQKELDQAGKSKDVNDDDEDDDEGGAQDLLDGADANAVPSMTGSETASKVSEQVSSLLEDSIQAVNRDEAKDTVLAINLMDDN